MPRPGGLRRRNCVNKCGNLERGCHIRLALPGEADVAKLHQTARCARLKLCTASTMAVTDSGGVNCEMPWPRLNTWPCPAAGLPYAVSERSTSARIWSGFANRMAGNFQLLLVGSFQQQAGACGQLCGKIPPGLANDLRFVNSLLPQQKPDAQIP